MDAKTPTEVKPQPTKPPRNRHPGLCPDCGVRKDICAAVGGCQPEAVTP